MAMETTDTRKISLLNQQYEINDNLLNYIKKELLPNGDCVIIVKSILEQFDFYNYRKNQCKIDLSLFDKKNEKCFNLDNNYNLMVIRLSQLDKMFNNYDNLYYDHSLPLINVSTIISTTQCITNLLISNLKQYQFPKLKKIIRLNHDQYHTTEQTIISNGIIFYQTNNIFKSCTNTMEIKKRFESLKIDIDH